MIYVLREQRYDYSVWNEDVGDYAKVHTDVAASSDRNVVVMYWDKLKKEYNEAKEKRTQYSEHLQEISKINQRRIRKFLTANRNLAKTPRYLQGSENEEPYVDAMIKQVSYDMSHSSDPRIRKRLLKSNFSKLPAFPELESLDQEPPEMPEHSPYSMEIISIKEIGKDLLID